MNSQALKEYMFANKKKTCRVKSNNILNAKMSIERKYGDGWKFVKISKIIFIDD